MKPFQPTLETLSNIRRDGSHKSVHPADVRGTFTFWRRLSAALFLLIYVWLPWIPINGYPSVFLDVQERRFHFFGLTLATQDLWLGFFLITGLAFLLFYITALFGRVWCGWACPYTVFLEHVYRAIERWIDGDAVTRRRLDESPWTYTKIVRRIAKHGLFIFVSLIIAHIFLSYFVSLKVLYQMMQGPPGENVMAFGIMLSLTAALYFCFSWFREQFCVILCPYGRLQSALTDDHSVVIGYDPLRGEPRGRAKAAAKGGDCIDCRRCVQVCPTGIDIRNGLQLDCIACAACVDACDEVMTKLERPKGLIRYDSHIGLHGGRTRLVRPRMLFYTVMLLAGVGALALSLQQLQPMNATVTRMVGAPYYLSDGLVRNQFLVRLVNKRNQPVTYRLELVGQLPDKTSVEGLADNISLLALGEEQKTLVLTVPMTAFKKPFKIAVKVTDAHTGASAVTRQMEFLGPNHNPKATSNAPLNPQDYIH